MEKHNPGTAQSKKEYVLGTGIDERDRLGIQHRIWSDATVAAWKRAGIGLGGRVLDLGSGPGYCAFDLSQMVGAKGTVVALDESDMFLDYLKQKAETLGVKNIETYKADVQNLGELPSKLGPLDAAYVRWVLCWLKNPLAAIQGVHSLLKVGGRFVVHDYFNWGAMSIVPRTEAVSEIVTAAVVSFRQQNGNVDIAADLPKMFKSCGFEVRDFQVHQRVARGGGLDSTLDWPLTWWRTYVPKLVSQGLLKPEVAEQAMRDLDDLEQDPDKMFFCPPLFEFICVKT